MERKPLVLCILDGYGIGSDHPGNAIHMAKTPNLDYLMKTYPNTLLDASGNAVGLPAGQMGNSEVGHLTIGSGRVVYTGLSLINKDLEEKTFGNKEAFVKLFDIVKQRHCRLHVMGLVSTGGVHSHQDHLIAFLRSAHDHNVPYVLHGFGDGRDVDVKSAIHDFATVDQVVKETNGKWGAVAGRFYAMDRDQRWERTELVYQAMTQNKCDNTYSNVIDYIQSCYNNDITDEFIPPATPDYYQGLRLDDNDVVFFFNFRPDRARQLCHLIRGSEKGTYQYFPRYQLENIYLVSLMQYEKINLDDVVYPPFDINQTLGDVLSQNNLKQLRLAETEKYAHVTFFFDGGKEVKLDNCDRILVPSKKDYPTYDLIPQMSASEISEALLHNLKKYDVVIMNYANPDMVGHTGNLRATVSALEYLDKEIGLIYQTISHLKGTLMIVADHGNAEVMLNDNYEPITSHSTSPVPFIVTDHKYTFKNKKGALADVGPTILHYLTLPVPQEMTGVNLLKKKGLFSSKRK